MAVAKAAMDSGVARAPIIDMDRYQVDLSARLNPAAGSLQAIFNAVRSNPRRVVFAEGEEQKSIRAAFAFLNSGYGTPILVGREERVRAAMEELGLGSSEGVEITNAKLSPSLDAYTEFLYQRVQRKGFLQRDCDRMVKRDRNVFAACMVATGDADAMVTGLTRNYHVALNQITRVLDPDPGGIVFGLSLVMARDRTFFVADTAVHELPSPIELADIAQQAASVARDMGHDPRVAMLSFANFGQPQLSRAKTMRLAVEELDARGVGFEYDGEMAVDVALNMELMANYPFCRLTGPPISWSCRACTARKSHRRCCTNWAAAPSSARC
jgi:malate dehydrogenase (oxaloacetate-decarboxylating)(NADP+)